MGMTDAPENIVLVGFSGTGKSLVGREIARILGWKFVDTDAEIEAAVGKSVQKIFEQEGEPAFRLMEKRSLQEVCSRRGSVISTGGGAVVDPENRDLMLGSGYVVCLDALPETIYRRLAGDGKSVADRPMLNAPDPLKRIKALKESRQRYYSLAHHTLNTDDLTVTRAAQEVVAALGSPQSHRDTEMEDRDMAAVVTHAGGSYPVLVGRDLLNDFGPRIVGLGVKGPVYIVSDERVFPLYGRPAQISLQRSGVEAHCFIVPSGERSKSLELAEAIYGWLAQRRAERGHGVVAVGGGVVGDLAGFVAATYLRGMRLIQVPTSMAAMVDASIGGKVAVNLPVGKNLVGAFYQPRMVLADVSALATLGRRELAEGWAEAIKHGLILDAELFDFLEVHADELLDPKTYGPGASDGGDGLDVATEAIHRSVAIKARIVTEDERETLGRRILLNYGHTIGHALEAATDYGEYLHGEAVSVGMMGAATIGEALGLIDGEVVQRQRWILERFGLPTSAAGVDPQRVLAAMSLDKKTEGGSVKWVLLEGVGRAVVRSDVPRMLVEETVRGLCR